MEDIVPCGLTFFNEFGVTLSYFNEFDTISQEYTQMKKLTFFFESGGAGWSESWYTEASFDEINSPLVWQPWVNARMELAATTVFMTGIRHSNEDDEQRYAQHVQFPIEGIPGGYWYGQAENPQDTSYNLRTDGLLVEFDCPALFSKRQQIFRGLPDSTVTLGQLSNANQNYMNNSLNKLLELMPDLGIEHRRTSIGLTGQRIIGFGAQTNDSPEVKIITPSTSTIPNVGDKIRIRKSKPWNKLNRTWGVKEIENVVLGGVDSKAITLTSSASLQAKGKPDSAEYLIEQYDNSPYTSVRIVGVTSRKTGRPSNGPRGRS
jgi:hypothetical protein